VLGERESLPPRPLGRDGEVGDGTGVEQVAVETVEVRVLEDVLPAPPT
jgi:hypothetical protein